jgi:hypothetical protein
MKKIVAFRSLIGVFQTGGSNMSLADDLANYMNARGHTSITPRAAEVVIVGETHESLWGGGEFRTEVMTRVVRELLKDQRVRYFGHESFQNAGPVRQAIRDYWLRHVLPPDFDPDAPDADSIDLQKVGAQVMPRRFQPVLDDLQARKRYVLAIGSRSHGQVIRDHRLAQHFLEEVADRRIPRGTPGVLVLGRSHAAAKPRFLGQTTTTRMILEQRGYDCVSILLMPDFVFTLAGSHPPIQLSDDSVYPLESPKPPLINPPQIRLSSLTSKSARFFNTRLAGSPFFRVCLGNGPEGTDSGNSIADEYEYILLEKQP